MSFIDYRTWLKTELESLPSIKKVVDYVSELAKDYPLVVIEAKETDSDMATGTNRRTRRDYLFEIHVYGIYEQEKRTKPEQETKFLTALDEIIDHFDNPNQWHTSGNDNRVHLGRGNLTTIADPSPKRKCTFEVAIFKMNG